MDGCTNGPPMSPHQAAPMGPPMSPHQAVPMVPQMHYNAEKFQGQQLVYQYGPQQPQPVQVVSPVVVAQLPTEAPGRMRCPTCQTDVVTSLTHKNGKLTWLICGVMSFTGLWPCCWIPFCVKSLRDVKHTCPNCNTVLHVHKRL